LVLSRHGRASISRLSLVLKIVARGSALMRPAVWRAIMMGFPPAVPRSRSKEN
jgi:hypothetical protein